MKVIKLVCPNCKANLELDDSREFGFCQYCGTKIFLAKEPPNVVINNVTINNTTNISINTNEQIEDGFDFEDEKINHSSNYHLIETDLNKNIEVIDKTVEGCLVDTFVIGFILIFGAATKWLDSPFYWISIIVILIIIKVIQTMRNK